MIKEIEIKTPIYETIQVGETVDVKWEASNGKQFDDKATADHYEFYHCKVKERGIDLPIGGATLLDFTCLEDLEKYERDYIYDEHIKKYQKETMVFPNTYVLYKEDNPDFYYDDDDYYCYTPHTHVYLVTLDDYKKILIEAIDQMQ